MKPSDQIAALPVRWDSRGDMKVLLITSRETRRWVMPKGWPIDGVKPWKAAAIEAEEEAGIRGRISKSRLGTYAYDKVLEDGSKRPCRVALYPMLVEKTLDDWKESGERTRKWFSPKAASRVVDEPGLRDLLRRLSEKPGKLKLFAKP